MSRTFLFVNVPAFGHVNPTIGLVEELVRRGHRVRYHLAPSASSQELERVGATVIPAQSSFEKLTPTPTKDGFASASLPLALLGEAEAAMPGVLKEIEAHKPDAVVYDAFSLAGRFAAQKTGTRGVKLSPSYPSNQRWSVFSPETAAEVAFTMPPPDMATLGAVTGRLKNEYGVELAPDMGAIFGHVEGSTLVFMPRAWHPVGEDFGASYHFIGPVLASTRVEAAPEPALQAFLDRPEPLVYVSLGTVFNAWQDFFPVAVEALKDLPVKVLLVTEKNAFGSALPASFFAAPFVPQLTALSKAAAFVTHGGMNSTMEAVMAGVPTVVIPQMVEQAATALRTAALGCGVKLTRRDVTKESLRAAVVRVLEDASFRAKAVELGAAARNAGGAARGADVIAN